MTFTLFIAIPGYDFGSGPILGCDFDSGSAQGVNSSLAQYRAAVWAQLHLGLQLFCLPVSS